MEALTLRGLIFTKLFRRNLVKGFFKAGQSAFFEGPISVLGTIKRSVLVLKFPEPDHSRAPNIFVTLMNKMSPPGTVTE